MRLEVVYHLLCHSLWQTKLSLPRWLIFCPIEGHAFKWSRFDSKLGCQFSRHLVNTQSVYSAWYEVCAVSLNIHRSVSVSGLAVVIMCKYWEILERSPDRINHITSERGRLYTLQVSCLTIHSEFAHRSRWQNNLQMIKIFSSFSASRLILIMTLIKEAHP